MRHHLPSDDEDENLHCSACLVEETQVRRIIYNRIFGGTRPHAIQVVYGR